MTGPDGPAPGSSGPDTHGPDTHGPDTHGPDTHVGPTAEEIAGLVGAERTAGEYVAAPDLTAALPHDPTTTGGVVPGSGDAAIVAAEIRAETTRGRDLADVPPLPIPADTANVRARPGLNPDCLPLLPLVGVWRGVGRFGNEPGEKDPQFGQQIVISHDGRPFLRYESISWLLEPDGSVRGPGHRELGFFRPQPDGSIELLVAHAEGRIELFYGRPRSAAAWALSTDAALRTPTAPPVVGATRLIGITPDGKLAYVEERAHSDIELSPHSSAALDRIAG
jgi:hypothetical protein